MLDIKRILNNPEEVRNALLKRMDDVSFDELIEWEKERKTKQTEIEDLNSIINKNSKQISCVMADKTLEMEEKKKRVEELKKITTEAGEKQTALRQVVKELETKIFDFLTSLPNIPDDDVVAGEKENNEVLHYYGEQPKFDFEPKTHIELCKNLGLIDYERGIKLSGEGSWIYTGLGAQLEWALINYFIDSHLKDGYQFMLPPIMLNYNCGFVAGQFPKFKEEVYWIDHQGADKSCKFILPTAETALVNLHNDEVFAADELPKKYFAYTPCFRREAGGTRLEEKGMIRGHQFNKVEMVQYTHPDKSDEAFAELVGKAEKLLQGLGLHYRLSKLAAGDCSAGMARTYDIEIWIPSMGIYKEVSSASNGRDYQTRRGNVRVVDVDGKKRYVHTLNASGLATSRVFPALIEQYQQADGSVVIPEVLRKYMGNLEKIVPTKKDWRINLLNYKNFYNFMKIWYWHGHSISL